MHKKPEILSPAGSMDALRAAVAAGCDAIYMGGVRFGARAYADNPDEEELIQAIQYCHLYGVKLYMTVNTLLKEEELETLPEYIAPFYRAGLDAAIVQDVGVMRCLHQYFPELALHASTQMTLTMGKGIEEYLAPYGVTRIVPARELSLSELRQMRQDTERELEVFVHGALCYCYSGQCLMSSMQGGRSGNRGRCAQPCRMPYRMEGQKRYMLSPKELCALPHIGEMIEAGIDSFKIEGRMKRPEYTAFVTAMYRKHRDLYCELGRESYAAWREENRHEWQEDLRGLAELYNREGFTDGYLTDSAADMLSSGRPKHGGVFIGRVRSVQRQQALIHLERDIEPQDVVEFRSASGETQYEYTVGQSQPAGESVWARFQKGSRIREGDGVYRTRHPKLLNKIAGEYLEGPKKLGIEGHFYAEAGKAIRLECRRDGATVRVEGIVAEAAKSRPAAEDEVRRVLMQTGDTPFMFTKLQLELQGELFLPVGELKRLRREALQKLMDALQGASKRSFHSIHGAEEGGVPISASHGVGEVGLSASASRSRNVDLQRSPERDAAPQLSVSAAVMRWEQLEAVLADGHVSEVIVRDEELTQEELAEAVGRIKQAGKRVVLAMPTIVRVQTFARYEAWLPAVRSLCPDGYLIRNLESLYFLRNRLGVPADLIRTDANLYIMNASAKEWWREQGIISYTAPWELTEKELLSLPEPHAMQWICYGKIPLMVSAQCIRRNFLQCRSGKGSGTLTPFRGEQGRRYTAASYCKNCYNVIYKEEPFMVCPEESFRKRWDQCRYEFTTESGREVREVLEGRMPETVSRGHFDRGVQ